MGYMRLSDEQKAYEDGYSDGLKDGVSKAIRVLHVNHLLTKFLPDYIKKILKVKS